MSVRGWTAVSGCAPRNLSVIWILASATQERSGAASRNGPVASQTARRTSAGGLIARKSRIQRGQLDADVRESMLARQDDDRAPSPRVEHRRGLGNDDG